MKKHSGGDSVHQHTVKNRLITQTPELMRPEAARGVWKVVDLLDVLLAIEQQAENCTQELLDTRGRRVLLQILLELEGAEVRQ